MAKKSLLPLLTLFFSSCISIKENPAILLVRQSMEAHGGRAAWEGAQKLAYDKTTILFDSTGQLESHVKQNHSYQLQPLFTGRISYFRNDTLHVIDYDGKKAVEQVNGKTLVDSASMSKALIAIVSAHYVMCQPFKLMDEGVELTYLGKDTLENIGIMDVVQANYKTSYTKNPPDTWWYYFDPVTKLLAANMVKHGKTFSFIVNLEYDTANGIIFNKHRKSYMVDSTRNIRYLRAEYFNENIRLE